VIETINTIRDSAVDTLPVSPNMAIRSNAYVPAIAKDTTDLIMIKNISLKKLSILISPFISSVSNYLTFILYHNTLCKCLHRVL
jgi:hypothetical protein